ncbi:MAG: hypothetical protein LBQ43_00355 [Holosporales bacterium]|jgi:hypothetical protein|nr:hypothetical protein [Holosporales bacterium]
MLSDPDITGVESPLENEATHLRALLRSKNGHLHHGIDHEVNLEMSHGVNLEMSHEIVVLSLHLKMECTRKNKSIDLSICAFLTS